MTTHSYTGKTEAQAPNQHKYHARTISRVIILVCLVTSLVCALSLALKGEILFHTDIARDHLLIEDIITRSKLTLIGPRTGGIPGVFHGPLWLYMNIPAFIAGGGDPRVVGWGWCLMWLTSLGVLFLSVRSMTRDTDHALIATTMYALLTWSYIVNYMNFSGAFLVTPVWFALIVWYTRTKSARYLAGAYLTLGIIIQLQMALGVPLWILTTIIALVHIVRTGRWAHLVSLLASLPFLLTFIAFDLRHDLLQSRSVMAYLFGAVSHGKTTLPLVPYLLERIHMVNTELMRLVSSRLISPVDIAMIIFFSAGFLIKSSLHESRNRSFPTDLAMYVGGVWVGYWIVTLPYRGVMWQYYYSPLTPVLVAGLVALLMSAYKRYGLIILSVLCILMLPLQDIPHIIEQPDIGQKNVGQWVYLVDRYERAMFDADAPREFGYFVFTRDQLGYAPTYAMHFLARRYPGFRPYENQKKKVTYLLAETEPHPVANKEYWTRYQVGITSAPTKVYPLAGNFVIEQYNLSADELQKPADPNLTQNLLFR